MNNNIEKQIKDRVSQEVDPIDPAIIWTGIESKLSDEPNKNKIPIWWFLFMGVFVASILAGVYYFTTQSDKTSQQLALVVNEESIKIQNSTEQKNNAIIIKNKLKEDNNLFQNPSNNIKVTTTRIVESYDDQLLVADNVKDNLIEKSVIGNSTIAQNKTSKLKNETTNTELVFTNKFEKLLDEISVNTIINSENNNLVQHVSPFDRKLTIPYLSSLVIAPVSDNSALTNLNAEYYPWDQPLPTKESTINLLNDIELFIGVGFGDKNVSSPNQIYNNNRNNQEQLLEILNMGVRINIVKILDLQLYSGIQYSTINDSWKWNDTYIENRLTTYVQSTTEYPGDSIETTTVTDTLPYIIERTVEQYNTHKIVSIPIGVSFCKDINRWQFGLGFGLDFNYKLASDGMILGEDLTPISYQNKAQWISPTYTTHLSARYYLSEHWSVSAQANFRSLSFNQNLPNITVNNQYKVYGVEMGISRRF